MSRDTVDINSDGNTSLINFAGGGLIITVTPSRKTLAQLEVETLDFSTSVKAINAAGPAILNEASSATNPTQITDRGDLTTGLGGVTGELDAIVGGVSAINIDSSLNVVVKLGSAGAFTPDGDSNDFGVEAAGNGGMFLATPDVNTSRLSFGSPTDDNGFRLQWNFSGSRADIGTAKVGATLDLEGDNQVSNISLSGAVGAIISDFIGRILKSRTDSITAGTTQTQAGATATTTDLNRISICANVGDGVALDDAVAGSEMTYVNDGAQNAQVWPKNGSGDTIDGGAADAVDANALVAGTTRRYICFTDGAWETA